MARESSRLHTSTYSRLLISALNCLSGPLGTDGFWTGLAKPPGVYQFRPVKRATRKLSCSHPGQFETCPPWVPGMAGLRPVLRRSLVTKDFRILWTAAFAATASLSSSLPADADTIYASNVGSNVVYGGSAAVDGAAESIGSMIPPCIAYGPDLRATSRVCTTLREGKTRIPICYPIVPQVSGRQNHETPIRPTQSPITPETLRQVSRRHVPTSMPRTCRSHNRRPG